MCGPTGAPQAQARDVKDDPWRSLSHKGSDHLLLHASAVALEGRGIVIAGASGAGKSSLTLAIMALGGRLVADDRVLVSRRECDKVLIGVAPAELTGQIEAYGIGILSAECAPAPLLLAVELGEVLAPRHPEPEMLALCGARIPLVRTCYSPYLAAAVVQRLRSTR
ncbi:MAG: serine kinase [Pseudomonadota bacterium]